MILVYTFIHFILHGTGRSIGNPFCLVVQSSSEGWCSCCIVTVVSIVAILWLSVASSPVSLQFKKWYIPCYCYCYCTCSLVTILYIRWSTSPFPVSYSIRVPHQLIHCIDHPYLHPHLGMVSKPSIYIDHRHRYIVSQQQGRQQHCIFISSLFRILPTEHSMLPLLIFSFLLLLLFLCFLDIIVQFLLLKNWKELVVLVLPQFSIFDPITALTFVL